MANEIHAYGETGLTLYAILLNTAGQVWNGSSFAAIAALDWGDYDIALTETTSGIYYANLPAVSAGEYSYVVYEQAGGSPATTDEKLGVGNLNWDGSAILPLSTIDADIATIDGIVDDILVDTGTTIPGTITTIDDEIAVIDGIVDDILVDTGTDGVLVADTQGAISWGQQKILADVESEGALHIVNSNAGGYGMNAQCDAGVGQRNYGNTGQLNYGYGNNSIGQNNVALDIDNEPGGPVYGQVNQATSVGENTLDSAAGQYNTGSTKDVDGYDTDIATAANQTTMDGKLDTIDGIVDDILVDTGTTLPASISAIDTDSVMDVAVDGTYTFKEVVQIMAAALAGKLSGGGTTTLTFRDLSDTLNRIVATVDSNKNRTDQVYTV
jgi:hypothetical protein